MKKAMTAEERAEYDADRAANKPLPGERRIDTLARILLGVLEKAEDEEAAAKAPKRRAPTKKQAPVAMRARTPGGSK